MADLNELVAELKRVAPRLHAYEPRDPSWQQAEKKAFEAREQLHVLLRSPEGVQKLRSSNALDDMRRLVPQVAREDISELHVADFVLGMLFVQPYVTFEDVYRGYGSEYGKELSAEARKNENTIKSSFIYGEILFFPFADAIRSVAPLLPEHAIFYDLGSGTGKAVIAASLLHPFDQAIGIELLEPLVACADKRKDALAKRGNVFQTDIEFLHDSILTTSWESGDLVFCHGTCFSDKEWAEISLAAEKLKQGAFFLSTSHVLKSALFEVVKSLNFKMSWGTATLYIHRRRKIGRWAAQMLRGGRATRTDLLEKQQKDGSSDGDKADETEFNMASKLLPLGAVRTEDGDVVVPASRRADGSVRKPIRIRQGYVPQDEVPKYKTVAQRKREEQNASEDKIVNDEPELSLQSLALESKAAAASSDQQKLMQASDQHKPRPVSAVPALTERKPPAKSAVALDTTNERNAELKQELSKLNKLLKEIAKLEAQGDNEEEATATALAPQQQRKVERKQELQRKRNEIIAELNGAAISSSASSTVANSGVETSKSNKKKTFVAIEM